MKTTHLTPAQKHSTTQPLPPRWPFQEGVRRRLAVFLGLAALLTLLAGGAVVGSVIPSHQALAGHATCHATHVTLHGGTAAPTISCLDGHQQGTGRRTLPGGGSGPLAHLVGVDNWCDDDALILYWDSPVGSTTGPWLCVDGAGVLNLNQYFNSYSWIDQASAFWTGCYNDLFYTGLNRTGASAYAPGSYDGDYSPAGTYPYQNVGNDQLASVYQFASEGGDNCW